MHISITAAQSLRSIDILFFAFILTQEWLQHDLPQRYQRFLQIRPKVAMAHFSLAALQMETQDLQGAVASLERGIALEPYHAGRWYNLVQLYRANTQAVEAKNASG